VETTGEPEDKEERQIDRRPQHSEAGPLACVLLSLPVALGVVDVTECCRHLWIEGADVQRVGGALEGVLDEERREDGDGPGVHGVRDEV
jgi:hypothetical protein